MTARITDKMFYEWTQSSVMDAQAAVSKWTRISLTGMKVVDASDDPSAAAFAMKSKAEMDRIETYRSNITLGNLRLKTAESSLNQIHDLLLRAKELGAQMLNETYGVAERRQAATELSQIKSTVIQQANAQVNGVYVFAGMKATTPAFDATGNYVGLDGDQKVEINENLFTSVTPKASLIFTSAGGTDLFSSLESMVTALNANDTTALRSAMGNTASASDQILSGLVDVGASRSRMQIADKANLQSKQVLSDARSDTVEADAAEAYSTLQQQRNGMEAALQIAATSMNMSILKYL